MGSCIMGAMKWDFHKIQLNPIEKGVFPMFAERLKEARKAKRYSQAEVSRMLGVTQQAVGAFHPRSADRGTPG